MFCFGVEREPCYPRQRERERRKVTESDRVRERDRASYSLHRLPLVIGAEGLQFRV